ncbi:MAG: hypothetical protein ACTSYS_01905, partial [Promethearchaeota archaeon]
MVDVERKNVIMCLVSHTHWDREWYLPFEKYRHKLVKLIDKLLGILDNDKRFSSFMLDGQTVIIEDYIEARPEKKEKFITYIKNGKIKIGPFFILPDEFLISPESHVRNLLLGRKISQQFGVFMNAGYMPDSFGHIAQIPQLLNGFNIDNFIFTRGMGDEIDDLDMEFSWIAPNGKSKVIAINLPGGYCAGANLTRNNVDFSRAANRIIKLREKLLKRAVTNILLIPNGCDHLTPEERIPDFIEYFNKFKNGAEGFIVHASLPEYIQMLKDTIKFFKDEEKKILKKVELKEFTGDFRYGREHPILSDVFSSRTYILKENVETELLMERFVEPLSVISEIITGGEYKYPQGYIWLAWRKVLLNHPHDSICGCSIDEVHEDVMVRFKHARQIGNDLVKDAMRYIVPRISFYPGLTEPREAPDTFEILVFNPSSFERSGLVHFWVKMKDLGEETCPENFKLYDDEGKEHFIINTKENVSPVPPSRMKFKDVFFRFEFFAQNVPALGFKTFYIIASEDEPVNDENDKWFKIGEESAPFIESSNYKITLNENGTFIIKDKMQDLVYEDCGLLIDETDVGDEYDFIPLKDNTIRSSINSKMKFLGFETKPREVSMIFKTSITIPAGLDDFRKKPSNVEVNIPVKWKITILEGEKFVKFKIKFENKAKDHRLRVVFPTGIRSSFKHVNQHFTILKKRIKLPDGKGWTQKPSPTDHHLNAVSILGTKQDKSAGVMIVTSALQEHEVNQETFGENSIILTLIRSVGWLGRPEGGAGPALATPEAQCLGSREHDLTFISFTPIESNDNDLEIPENLFRIIDISNVSMQCVVPRNYKEYTNTDPFPAILD